jgi:hypothetical protein
MPPLVNLLLFQDMPDLDAAAREFYMEIRSDTVKKNKIKNY